MEKKKKKKKQEKKVTNMGRKVKVLPPDDPSYVNQSAFRIVERSFKRKGPLPESVQKTIIDPYLPDIPGTTVVTIPNLQSRCPHFGSPDTSESSSHAADLRNNQSHDHPSSADGTSSSSSSSSTAPASSSSSASSSPASEPPIQALHFDAYPGLYFIRNPYTPSAQRQVITDCMRTWTRRPNVTNLDTHYIIEYGPGGLWGVYEREWKEREEKGRSQGRGGKKKRKVEGNEGNGLGGVVGNGKLEEHANGEVKKQKVKKEASGKKEQEEEVLEPDTLLARRTEEVGWQGGYKDDEEGKSRAVDKIPASSTSSMMENDNETNSKLHSNITDQPATATTTAAVKTPIQIDPPTTATPLLTALPVSKAIKQWRWCSLGLQYNWSTKEYHMDRPVQVPPVINEMTLAVVKSLESVTGYDAGKYKCEAGIINFYQLGDSLTAHQDRSELNAVAPLVSFR
jgi:alkylated DNA repair protein alkB family protein 1